MSKLDKRHEIRAQPRSTTEVDLRGAELIGADLTGADLRGAILLNPPHLSMSTINADETTTLPDGTPWTRDTDMRRFTNPDHSDFWRSDDPESPAYAPPS